MGILLVGMATLDPRNESFNNDKGHSKRSFEGSSSVLPLAYRQQSKTWLEIRTQARQRLCKGTTKRQLIKNVYSVIMSENAIGRVDQCNE